MKKAGFIKKLIIASVVLGCKFLYAADLPVLLQDLAVQTACIGQYSATQAGGQWYNDPIDYYTPSILAERFKRMSGKTTKTDTFYGICFNYAQEAWNDIKKYKSDYAATGMKNSEWYIAATSNDSSVITLYDPTTEKNATDKFNGVFVKKNSRHNVAGHGDAKNHAWLWVQHKNGTWLWIDPTWTDNSGYVVWGYVKDGREIQCMPESRFCIMPPPSYLAQFSFDGRNSVSQNQTKGTLDGIYINGIYARAKKITSTESGRLKETDLIDMFFEELEKHITDETYKYYYWAYDVYKEEDKQNLPWGVYEVEYYTDYTQEYSVFLHINNGWIGRLSSNREFTVKGNTSEKTFDNNHGLFCDENNNSDLFLAESLKWYKRYGFLNISKRMSEGLMYFRNKFCFNEYVTKKYNKRVSTYAIDEKIKDIFIEFKIYPNLGDITDYCPIRDVWFDDEKKKLRVFCKRQQKLV